jgi:predicted dehydrogenase
MNRLRAAVVGAGGIGSRLDAPGTAMPLTHAGGFRAAGFELAALVDIAADLPAEAARWDCKAYADFDAMMTAQKPDLVSLCVSAPARLELLRAALAFRPKAVIAEKPLTTDSSDAHAIGEAYKAAGVPLIVNYTRRFVPAFQRLAGMTAMTGTIRYAKGVRHNGTHAIDLCRMLFGECLDATALSRKTDFWPNDPTVSAFLRFERCPEIFLQALDERCFTLFEPDIVTSHERIVIDQDGRRLRRWQVTDHVGIPPGLRLVENTAQDTGADRAMLNLMSHVRDVIAGAPPLCGAADAAAAQAIAEQLST